MKDKPYRTVRLRLRPLKRGQATQLYAVAGACRFVWNKYVERANRREFKRYTFFALCASFPQLRNHPEYNWLQEYSSTIVRNTVCKRFAAAYQAFFDGVRDRPKFHSRYGRKSFDLYEGTFKRDGWDLYIQKIGWMKLKGADAYEGLGEVKKMTVKEELGKWYAYLVYELDADPQDYPTEHTILGVDVGVAIPVACSNGNDYPLPDGSRLEAKIKRYQRKVARQQKGSKRSKKTYLRIAKAKRKQKHIRHNWAHHVSKDLAKSRVVAFEDLNVAGMTKSANGTPDKPGKHVRAKSGLNREILDKSWYQVALLTAYKACETVLVDPKHTSQTCSHCGCVCASNRRTQALYHCGACGLKINADLNASINIAKRALEKCPQTDRDQYRIEMASGSGASGHGRSVLTRDSNDPPTYVLGLT